MQFRPPARTAAVAALGLAGALASPASARTPARPNVVSISAERDEPFLLCLWTYDVDAPFQANPDLLAGYAARDLPAPSAAPRWRP